MKLIPLKLNIMQRINKFIELNSQNEQCELLESFKVLKRLVYGGDAKKAYMSFCPVEMQSKH